MEMSLGPELIRRGGRIPGKSFAIRSRRDIVVKQWSGRGSNPQPPHCERGALPIELPPHLDHSNI